MKQFIPCEGSPNRVMSKVFRQRFRGVSIASSARIFFVLFILEHKLLNMFPIIRFLGLEEMAMLE